jgi:hypothetical protein
LERQACRHQNKKPQPLAAPRIFLYFYPVKRIISMKKSMLIFLIIPLAGLPLFSVNQETTVNLLEVRSDPWPINLQRTISSRDTSYALEFRDQQVLTGVMLDTLPFGNLEQLRYFEQGLSALKKGHNGDIATYEHYSVKRTDVKNKKEPAWYLLRFQSGLTNFQQPEADKLIDFIRSLK